MMTLKPKNSEGFDRISQGVLLDGLEYLPPPLKRLFHQFYNLRQVPDQWFVPVTIPNYKNNRECQNV
jgi:hypothetical protein